MRHRPVPPLAADEQDVAFFGAVDNRAYLFLLAVALQSVARFHRQAGFFVLCPHGSRLSWTPLLHSWSNGTAELIELEPDQSRQFQRSTGTYSAMTFHRLRMPELLAMRGYAYSVNIDPDVLCVAPWDLSIFPQIRLLAGRPVRPSDGGVPMWVTERSTKLLNSSLRAIGISEAALKHELNGGVIIFNNVRAVRVGLLQLCLRYFGALRDSLEGDQDLLSVVLADNPGFPVFKLPCTYNFAFQRDREIVPNVLGMRLRLAIYNQLIAVHFVVDGKPWEQQLMPAKDYPPWLLVARLHHLRHWLKLARSLRPPPLSILTTPDELRGMSAPARKALGADGVRSATRQGSRGAHAVVAAELTPIGSLVNTDVLIVCRCFLKTLAVSKRADPLTAFKAEEALAGANSSNPMEIVARRRAWYHRQRALVVSQREELLVDCEAALIGVDKSDNCESVLHARAGALVGGRF